MGTGRVAFVSDLHVMSRFGLMPPGWRQRADPLYPVQRYLWRCWQHFVRTCPPLDLLVVVGDLREGTVQVHGNPRGSASDDPAHQNAATADALLPLARKADAVYLTRGTEFHEGGDAVEAVGEKLKAEKWAPGGQYSGHVLNLEYRGLKLNVSHHQTRGWMWLGGAASRLAVLSAAAEAVRKLPRADVIVRGDLHTYLNVRTLGKWLCFLPGWTMPNVHAIQRMESTRAHLATDIGAVVMTVGKDGTVGWREWLYDLARQTVVKAG